MSNETLIQTENQNRRTLREQEKQKVLSALRKKTVWKVIRRTLLVLFTVIVLAFIGVVLICNQIFNGPSIAARDVLTMSMLESSGMKWTPGLFIGQDTVDKIKEDVAVELPDELTDLSQIQISINTDSSIGGENNEWKDHPDGIRIERISGDSYNAHIMIIRNPAQVYLATSTERFSESIPGARINKHIDTEGAIAAINAGAFNDDGTSSSVVGSCPEGLVLSKGKVVWKTGKAPEEGFCGFNEDNILVVAKTMTAEKAQELNIRDGCCFGPVLIMNGNINEEAYNSKSGYNPRTCIGQRADGAVIFLCIDGRQASSLGGTYRDCIDILVEYGAVNACNLDGGSSTVMYYRDTYGLYGEPGQVQMINNYSLLQEQPRRMPTFFMVRPADEEG